MQDFTIGIKIQKEAKNYYIVRLFDKFFDEKMKFDFKRFYQENYAIFESTENTEDLISITDADILGYINFQTVNTYNIKDIIEAQTVSAPLSSVFFIEGGYYQLLDADGNALGRFGFNRRIGKFGLVEKTLSGLGDVSFLVYPSKIVDKNFMSDMANKLNELFPGSIIDSSGAKFVKTESEQDEIENMSHLKYQLETIRPFSEVITKSEKIKKWDLDLMKHELSQSLENYILERGGFDKIRDDEELEIKVKETVYNIPENQYIIGILSFFKQKYNIDYFDNIIEKYSTLGVTPMLDDKIPQKLYQHPVFVMLVRLYKKYKNTQKTKIEYILGTTAKKIDVGYDSLKAFTQLYEAYCFLEFKLFLENLGVNFIDSLKDKLYDKDTKSIIRYEQDATKGYIEGYLKKDKINLYFGDKLSENNKRHYKFLNTNEDYSYLGRHFRKVDPKNGITPDITLEIGDKFIICDVKFSSFRDFDSKMDYPNPDYFTKELHKYRRLFVNDKIIDTPIIIFYPGDISEENMDNFQKIHNLILNSYNMFLFPVYRKNEKVNEFLKEQFISITNN